MKSIVTLVHGAKQEGEHRVKQSNRLGYVQIRFAFNIKTSHQSLDISGSGEESRFMT